MTKDVEVRWESPVPGAHWHRNWRLGEWLAQPVTPLFATSLLPALVEGRERYGPGHLGWEQPPTFSMLEPWYCIVNGYFFTRDDRDLPTQRFGGGSPADRAARLAAQTDWLQNWRSTHRPAYMQRFRRLQRFDPHRAAGMAILDFLDDVYRDAAEWWYLLARIGFGSEEGTLRAVYDQYVSEAERPPISALFSGYSNGTLQSQQELYAIYGWVKTKPALREHLLSANPNQLNPNALLLEGRPTQTTFSLAALQGPDEVFGELGASAEGRELADRLNQYLRRRGHQVFSLDFRFPTLGERPDVPLAALQSYLRQNPPEPRREFARQRGRRRRALRSVRRLLANRPESWESLEPALHWRQVCAAIRENAIYDFQRLWPLMRRALLELGRRFAAAGGIEDSEDLFFLERDELGRAAGALDDVSRPDPALDFRDQVQSRRALWEAQAALAPPAHLPLEYEEGWRTGLPVRGEDWGKIAQGPEGRQLIGQSASSGRARGPARVLRTPEDLARFQRGEILVSVTQNPAWTVVFPLVAGVVTEVGGPATHSSLVAREYSIPAVVATGIATQVIRNGQIVTVDGSRGLVILEET